MIYGRSERLEEQADTGETQDSMEVCHARTLSGPRSASLRSLTAEDWGVNLGEGAWSPQFGPSEQFQHPGTRLEVRVSSEHLIKSRRKSFGCSRNE